MFTKVRTQISVQRGKVIHICYFVPFKNFVFRLVKQCKIEYKLFRNNKIVSAYNGQNILNAGLSTPLRRRRCGARIFGRETTFSHGHSGEVRFKTFINYFLNLIWFICYFPLMCM